MIERPSGINRHQICTLGVMLYAGTELIRSPYDHSTVHVEYVLLEGSWDRYHDVKVRFCGRSIF